MNIETRLTARLAALLRAASRLPPNVGKTVRVAVTVILVVVLVRLVGLEALVGLVTSARPGPLLLAIVLSFADRALMIGKWYPLLHRQVPHVSLGRAARVYLAAGISNYVLPSSIGSDVLRAVALGRGDQTVIGVGASVAMERLLGLLASVIVALLALVFATQKQLPLDGLLPWAIGALLIILLLTALFLGRWATEWLERRLAPDRPSRWRRLVHRFAAACAMYRHSPRLLIVVGVLSIVEQGFPIIVLGVLSRALDTPITLGMLVVAVPLSLFVGRLPISFAGIGVFEGLLVYLLGFHGIAPVDSLALGVAGRIAELAAQIPGVFLWRDLMTSARKQPEPLAAVAPSAAEE